MPPRRIGFEDRAQIELHYSALAGDITEVVRDTSRLLALMTGQAALVMAPRLESVTVERVKFVRVREQEVLAGFVAAAGGGLDRLGSTAVGYTQRRMDRLSALPNDLLVLRTRR